MFLYELRVPELKKELEKRNLSTDGSKGTLQARLREAMEKEGFDAEQHDFGKEVTDAESVEKIEDDKQPLVETTQVPSGSFDLSQLMAVMNQLMAQQGEQSNKMMGQMGEMKQQNERQLQTITQSNQEIKRQMEQQGEEIKIQITDGQKRMDEKLLELSTSLHDEVEKLQIELQTEIQHVKTEFKTDIQLVEEKFQRLEKELTDVKASGTTAQVVQTVQSIKLKPPTFDGTTSFGIFKFQFETAANQNNWNDQHRVAALIVALKGEAAEALQTIPEQERNSYLEIMKALDRKYGSDHKREIYRMELKSRYQKGGESLQEFSSAIERLVHLAHTSTSADYMERLKIDAFIDGIRDPETRRAVMLSPKATFAETIACALTNETAQAITKPSMKIRRVEIDTSVNTERSAPRYRDGSSKIRCWTCDKTGHISRDCWETRRKRGRSPSPMQRRPSGGQVARWNERLQSYDFQIEHRKGSAHGNADALSRRPCPVECKHCGHVEGKEGIIDVRLMQVLPDEEWTDEMIRNEQLRDSDLSVIIGFKEKEHRPTWSEISDKTPIVKAYWAQWDSLHIENGCLKRMWESTDGKVTQLLLVVPKSRIAEILKEYHGGASGGHLGINKTLAKIRQRFYWAGCRQSVIEWCQKCDQCAAVKGPARKSRGTMKQYNVGAPFERIAMDVAGPFPTTESGNKYVLVIMDYFSKWPEVYPIPNQETTTIADAVVNNWISRFGVPMEIHTDQGRNFESVVFQEICQMLGINKTRTTPLHPQSDGMVERFNGTLEEYLAKVVEKNQRNWDRHIPMFLMAYRSAIHDTTGMTPAKTIFGYNLRLPGDLKFGAVPSAALCGQDYVDRMKEELNEVHQFVREKIRMSSDRMKARYDVRANNQGFQEGQLVWLHNPQRKKGLSPKLQPSWEGPYTVIKKMNDVVYRIQKGHRGKPKVVHLERMAQYRGGDLGPVRDEQA